VIVLVIDQDCVFAFKLERKASVLLYPYGPAARVIGLERMPAPTRQIRIHCAGGRIELSQLQPQLVRMFRLNAGFRVLAEELLKAIMTEAFDHELVYRIEIH
jgi:hypothetical protein